MYSAITVSVLSLNLKSNMDRFIVNRHNKIFFCHEYLKSNMDRFIVNACYNLLNRQKNLKSNMDRFIVSYLHSKTT